MDVATNVGCTQPFGTAAEETKESVDNTSAIDGGFGLDEGSADEDTNAVRLVMLEHYGATSSAVQTWQCMTERFLHLAMKCTVTHARPQN